MSSGCASFSAEGPPPAASNDIELSRECEHLARTVDHPKLGPRPDPWRVIGEYAVALGDANGNLDASAECQRRQRERLSQGK